MSDFGSFDTGYGGTATIVALDSHRNGVGGATAIVALLDVTGIDDSVRRFVTTSFYGEGNEKSEYRRISAFISQTVALDVNETAAGNIGFAQGNSWRGSDMFGAGIAEAWRQYCRETWEYDPFDPEWGVDAD